MLTVNESFLRKDDSLDLAVTISNLKVTVQKGTFRRHGIDYILDDDIEHDVEVDSSFSTTVTGYLVLSNGVPTLLVDEVVKDGYDESFRFDDPDIKFLRVLFTARNIPAGTTDLGAADVDFQVFKITKIEEGEE